MLPCLTVIRIMLGSEGVIAHFVLTEKKLAGAICWACVHDVALKLFQHNWKRVSEECSRSPDTPTCSDLDERMYTRDARLRLNWIIMRR